MVDYETFNLDFSSEVKKLKNFSEIKSQIEKEERIAMENGIDLGERAWHVQIDSETNTGKPYISDLKRVSLVRY